MSDFSTSETTSTDATRHAIAIIIAADCGITL